MTEFEFLAIGISLILGLGTTLLLSSFLTVFVNRHEIKFDWIPIVWAFFVLIIQIQYYAATWKLNSVTEWNFSRFASPLLLAGLIFIAAGIVLPTGQGKYPTDLRTYFERNGKWAVGALAIRGVVAILTNHIIWNNYSFNLSDILISLQIVFALLFLFSKKRKLLVSFTLLYGLTYFLTMVTIYAF